MNEWGKQIETVKVKSTVSFRWAVNSWASQQIGGNRRKQGQWE